MDIIIKVKNRDVLIEYGEKGTRLKKIGWQDNADISQKFLKFLDKINKCNKHKVNCLFNRKSDSLLKSSRVVLFRLGRENTTWRNILISLKALAWAKRVELEVKSGK